MEPINRAKFFAAISTLPPGDLLEIQYAYYMAKDAHRVQVRDGGERYFDHPRAVAYTLIEAGVRSKSAIIKGLLHDVVEDTFVPHGIIVAVFRQEMWHSLVRLSKKIPVFDPVTGALIGRFDKDLDEYYLDLAEGPEEDQLVKVADRLHNHRTMKEGWPVERQKKKALETEKYILPMADKVAPLFAIELRGIIAPLLAS